MKDLLFIRLGNVSDQNMKLIRCLFWKMMQNFSEFTKKKKAMCFFKSLISVLIYNIFS